MTGSPRSMPRVRKMGDDAVLIDCDSLDAARGVFAALERTRQGGSFVVDALIPAAETVLVIGGEAADSDALDARLPELLSGSRSAETVSASEGALQLVPVVYDGADLDAVSELTSLSVEQVIARHLAAEYTVAFTGFAPGFAYLTGGDPALAVPRLDTPRARIPAGAVAIAGEFSAVYPRESPGGWRLIGRTELVLWDESRKPPATLRPGTQVQFERVREAIDVRARPPAAVSQCAPEASGTAVLEVEEAGLSLLVQDGGRHGYLASGVGRSGAADRGALATANRTVGNREDEAALELGLGGFAARVLSTAVLALHGAVRSGTVSGPLGERPVDSGQAFRVNAGECLVLGPPERGVRTMLAVRGGVDAEVVLGSRSRDTLAGLGPRPLHVGDTVRRGDRAVSAIQQSAVTAELPAPGQTAELSLTFGPRDEWFTAASLEVLLRTEWEVTPRSDRIGLRLSGPALERTAAFQQAELPSEGLVQGAIQVPPDGRPLIFLADHPITGGYPVIGVLSARDRDLAAQLAPGVRVRFRDDARMEGT